MAHHQQTALDFGMLLLVLHIEAEVGRPTVGFVLIVQASCD